MGNTKSGEKENNDALMPINREVVEVLVSNHKQFLRFLVKRVGSKETAEEILQTSLKKAIEHPSFSESKMSILSWFYTILKNTLTDHYRNKATKEKLHQEYEKEVDGKRVDAPDELEDALCQCMRELLPTLKPAYAELIEKIDLQEQEIKNVSSQLGITKNNLMVRLHRARQALKTSLVRSCGTCTEHGCLDCICK